MDASLYLEGCIHFDSLFRLKQNPARNLGRVLFLYHIIYAFENEADSISFFEFRAWREQNPLCCDS